MVKKLRERQLVLENVDCTLFFCKMGPQTLSIFEVIANSRSICNSILLLIH
jgi:hypothetical protein